MRLGKGFSIENFRRYIETVDDAVFEEPRTSSGEVLRFRIGKARGTVSRRADGSFTLTTMAIDLHREFEKGQQ